MELETTQLGTGPAPQTVEITGLTADSRTARPGYLFAALPGTRADGRDFIQDALSRGVAAVLVPKRYRIEGAAARNVVFIADENPRRRFALMAAQFFGAQPGTIAAVTGTNGKTSVVAFTRQIWTHCGFSAASIGTLGLNAPGTIRPGALTTPDPVSLHQLLADLTGSGVDHLAMEASSHGLEQFRLDGVRVTAAAFTNLSRDHLDYHGSMEAYWRAKQRLFDTVMAPSGTAVLNADALEFDSLQSICRARGHPIVSVFGSPVETEVPLAGAFQAANVLCALGLAVTGGAPQEKALAALPLLEGAKGRMQRVAKVNGAPVYVDYAHTPDALENALAALRPHAAGRLVVVFGCGGDRDPGKRPIMGGIAARLADRVIITDDNPRGEDPAVIRRAILDGCPAGAAPVREIGDRAAAIAEAIRGLEPGDLLVIAGKGHEPGQIVGDSVLPFDDAEVARATIAEMQGDRQ